MHHTTPFADFVATRASTFPSFPSKRLSLSHCFHTENPYHIAPLGVYNLSRTDSNVVVDLVPTARRDATRRDAALRDGRHRTTNDGRKEGGNARAQKPTTTRSDVRSGDARFVDARSESNSIHPTASEGRGKVN
jgi:hypothetical protein